MGNPFGPPNDPDIQGTILVAAMRLATEATTPGAIVDHAAHWPEDFSTRVRDTLLSDT